ncbi:hypothetical protein [Catellatospora sp. NPDC049133]|uniref:hypothetical protein n=1 Tax=Catellatospora sp. NPDC049133 TaxID=3155499 RepID=UPI0033C32C20
MTTEGHADLGPAPDLSRYDASVSPEAYEWWLSDHPWAAAERTRRHAAEQQDELDRAERIADWIARTHAADASGDLVDRPDGWRDNLVGLATAVTPLAEEARLRATLDSAEPDDLRVVRLREALERKRRLEGEPQYAYPQHLQGPGAATYPPPGWNPQQQTRA